MCLLKINKSFENTQFEKEYCTKDKKFRYMLLDRMRMDCDYELGNGKIYGGHLWAGNAEEQIKDMISLWKSFPEDEKPEWLTLEELNKYSIELTSKKLEEW